MPRKQAKRSGGGGDEDSSLQPSESNRRSVLSLQKRGDRKKGKKKNKKTVEGGSHEEEQASSSTLKPPRTPESGAGSSDDQSRPASTSIPIATPGDKHPKTTMQMSSSPYHNELASRKGHLASSYGAGSHSRSSSGTYSSSYSSSMSDAESEDELPITMRVQRTISGFTDFRVADLSLSDRGRLEIEQTKREMPGLATLVQRRQHEQPLLGANIVGCLHVTPQTAVLIEALVALGARVRWCGSNVYSTHNDTASALAANNIPVFAWRGQSEEDFWFCMRKCVEAPGWLPNMVLDDGGDLTHLLHREYPKLCKKLRGVTEATMTGVHRLMQLKQHQLLRVPALNVNDCVTKSQFDNKYGVRDTIVDSIKRVYNVLIAGKKVCVCGYGDVGKGVARAFQSYQAVVHVSEADPICALQAAVEGYQVVTMETAAPICDVFVTCTGNRDVIQRRHFDMMKDNAVVCNAGHFGTELSFDVLSLIRNRREAVWSQQEQKRTESTGSRSKDPPSSSKPLSPRRNASLPNLQEGGDGESSLKRGSLRKMSGQASQTSFLRRISSCGLLPSKDSDLIWRHVRPMVDIIEWPNGKRVVILAEGRAVNMACGKGHPSFVMSVTFTAQILAQIELFTAAPNKYSKKEVYLLPRRLDEEVARLHLGAFDAELTVLTDQQLCYLGLKPKGPFKSSHYRY